MADNYIDPTAKVNEHVHLGKGSKIWAFCNVYGTAKHPVIIGENAQIGSHSEIKPRVRIGDNCRFQYGLFIPDGVSIDHDVFIGPRVTFTNDKYPDIKKTLDGTWKCLHTNVEPYVSLGGHLSIGPGIVVGRFAQVGLGAVVTKNVDPFAVMVGVPARKVGDIRDEKFKGKYASLLKIAEEHGWLQS